MSEELKQCPFCGSNTAPHVTDDVCDCCIDFTVVCNARNGGCGASGRFEKTKDAAIAEWNRRPSPGDHFAGGGNMISDEEIERIARQILNFSEYQGLPSWVKPFARALLARCHDENARYSARYRWLRSRFTSEEGIAGNIEIGFDDVLCCHQSKAGEWPTAVDVAIDAAMSIGDNQP